MNAYKNILMVGREAPHRYGLAVLAAIAALLLRQLLSPLLGLNNPYHTAWAAVIFCAWYCGVGPAILAICIEVVGVWYWFLAPTNSFKLEDLKSQITGILGFLFFSALIVALGEANRRSLHKSERAEEQIREAHAELELKIQERTSELSVANQSLRQLSSRLQQMRDEERRQIARELHDSVGQMLAAVSMNIGIVHTHAHNLDPTAARAISENAALVQQISSDIRTISHLLHPPLLDVAGLASALRWYVDGFSERSKIQVDVDIPSDFARLSDETELAVFRMVQECLTNIHRHSGAKSAAIRILQQESHFLVEIRDTGRGIPVERQLEINCSGRAGVGFRGMRERLTQLGGSLDIHSNGQGTVVTAILPLTLSIAPPDGAIRKPSSDTHTSACNSAA